MCRPGKTLFAPGVVPERLNPHFERLRSAPEWEPARWMLDDIYQHFEDPEGNFLEQFQTGGFDARFFELYLFAYFSRSGFEVNRTHPSPDFLVSRQGLTVAIEATTVNPSTSGTLASLGKKISDLSPEEIAEYQRNELPVRFGSPLLSKLQKKYWELDHCRDLPFVVAIEAFHDEESLALSDSALSRYAFGLDCATAWDVDGNLKIDWSEVHEHTVGSKTIPSNFFAQPEVKHLSAIVFTNSGTNSKFARMGYQNGVGCDTIEMRRVGYSLNPAPDALDPTLFSYNLDDPPFVESWGQGLVVLHNPNCVRPLPKSFFAEAVQGSLEGDRIKMEVSNWHPFASCTIISLAGEIKKLSREVLLAARPRIAVGAISKREFVAMCGFDMRNDNSISEEQGWFADEAGVFLGVVFHDKVDDDWGWAVLARDQYFRFRAIDTAIDVTSRDRARREVQDKIAGLLGAPQRMFPQYD